jgi:hypothetical protein
MFPRRLINNKNAVLSAMKRSFSKEAASAPKEAPKVAKDIPKKEGGGGSSFFVFVAATGAFLYADPFELKEIKQLKAQLGLLPVDVPAMKKDICDMIDAGIFCYYYCHYYYYYYYYYYCHYYYYYYYCHYYYYYYYQLIMLEVMELVLDQH